MLGVTGVPAAINTPLPLFLEMLLVSVLGGETQLDPGRNGLGLDGLGLGHVGLGSLGHRNGIVGCNLQSRAGHSRLTAILDLSSVVSCKLLDEMEISACAVQPPSRHQ